VPVRAAGSLAVLPPGLGLPLAVIVAVAGGATLAVLRLDAVGGARLVAATGRYVHADATLLEPLKRRGAGPAVARARLAGGGLTGEVAVIRASPAKLGGRWPAIGE